MRVSAAPAPLSQRCSAEVFVDATIRSIGGLLWTFGWLFTVGFLEMTFWRAVVALILWPYYLGVMVNALLKWD
jgi:hypothetical protein